MRAWGLHYNETVSKWAIHKNDTNSYLQDRQYNLWFDGRSKNECVGMYYDLGGIRGQQVPF